MPRIPKTPAARPALAPARPQTAPIATDRAETLPGLREVLKELTSRRGLNRAAALFAGEAPEKDDLGDFDIPGERAEPAVRSGPPARNTLNDLRLALVRLRIHAMMSNADMSALSPDPGYLRVISVPREADRPVVEPVLLELSRDLPYSITVFNNSDTSAGSGLNSVIIKRIREDLLRGRGVIAIMSSASNLPDDLRAPMLPELRLPPLTCDMLRAVLAFHFDETDLELPGSDHQIGRLSEIGIVSILAAPDPDAAIRALRRLMCSGSVQIGVTLENVHGQPNAVSALRQVAIDLHAFQSGQLRWEEVTKSFLLLGPPGTGKTMLAEALAGSAGITIVKTSYSDCQKHGHQGDMLKELDRKVETAIISVPCVFFIDEIDSFHSRKDRTGSKDGYILGVVNGLLTQLDRLSATPGVIIIAATNYPDRVDPAVIRPGRFDKHILVGKPDRSGIRAMLSESLADIINADDLDGLSDQLLGLTGAGIAAMLRDARTRARTARATLAMTHVRAAADAIQPTFEGDLLWRVAVHEAGHVLAGHLLDLPPATAVRIAPEDSYVTRFRPVLRVPDTVHRLICAHLAGRIAEEMIFDIPSDGAGNGSDSDLAQATRVAVEAECAHGFGVSLAWSDPKTPFHTLPRPVQVRVEARLQAAADDVRRLFLAHRADLERIARVLLDRRELDTDAITALMRDIPRSGDLSEMGKGMTHGF